MPSPPRKRYKKWLDAGEDVEEIPYRTARRLELQMFGDSAEAGSSRDRQASVSNNTFFKDDSNSGAFYNESNNGLSEAESSSDREESIPNNSKSCGKSHEESLMDRNSNSQASNAYKSDVDVSGESSDNDEESTVFYFMEEDGPGDGRPISPIYLSDEETEEGGSDNPSSGDEQENNGVPTQPTFGRLQKGLEGEFSTPISIAVSANPAEILRNALELSKQHRFPHDVHANIMKLLNSLFPINIFPETRYLLDQLYVSSCGIKYHYWCQKCTSLFEDINIDAVETILCDLCSEVTNVKKSKADCKYFVTLDIPLQLQLLLKSENVYAQLKSPRELIQSSDGNIHDLHHGEMYRNYATSLDYSKNTKYISLTMDIDGSPLFKSSDTQVWPLFLSINELPPIIRLKKLILAAFWFGPTKPLFDVMFAVFVKLMNVLSETGCEIRVEEQPQHFTIHVIACCVDSGVRGVIQKCHQHNGEYGCNWCLHPGQTYPGTNVRRYTKNISGQLRTQEEVLADGETAQDMPEVRGQKPHVNGVLGISLLTYLKKFNIVDGMIVDYLHGKNLGVARSFTKLWMGTEGIDKIITENRPKGKNPNHYIGTPDNILKIDKRIKALTPTVETRRMPRSINDLKNYKAREWENFILHNSVLVLKDILPDTYLNHWVLFVQGSWLLLQENLSPQDIDLAEKLLVKFADDTEELYKNGDIAIFPEKPCSQAKFNLHILRHAAENARRWGPDWCISSYVYESGNGDIKHIINAKNGIDKQIIRFYSQELAREILNNSPIATTVRSNDFISTIRKKKVSRSLTVGDCNLLGSITTLTPSEEENFLLTRAEINGNQFVQCEKMIRRHCVFTIATYQKATRRNNSVVQFIDLTFGVIRKIVASERLEKVFVFCSKIWSEPFNMPSISNINKRFLYTISLVEEGLCLKSVDDIKTLCVYSDVPPLGQTLSPMPNTYTFG